MGTISFSSVKLVKGGTIQGNDNAAGDVSISQYYSFGGAADLWGLALSDTDINANDFGVVFSFVGSGFPANFTTHYVKAVDFDFTIPVGATINGVVVEAKCRPAATQIQVDHIRITVYYTEIAVGTNMKVNISDVFKDISEIKVNIGDVWKDVTKIQINIGDAWKTVFE